MARFMGEEQLSIQLLGEEQLSARHCLGEG